MLVIYNLFHRQTIITGQYVFAIPVFPPRWNYFAFVSGDPDKRRCVQFSPDSPVKAGSFGTIGRQSLLRFGETLFPSILFRHPQLLLSIPDAYCTVGILTAMTTHPIQRTDSFIKDIHVAPGILV